MSTVGSFDRHLHFAELASPLDSQGEGFLSPSTRRARSSANLGLSLPRANGGANVIRGMPAVATAIDTITLTAAQILNGVIHGTPTAAATYTTITGTLLDAALPDFEVGDALLFTVVNLAATATFDITMAGGVGVTTVGPTRVGAGSATPNVGDEWQAGEFALRKTATATYQLIRIL